MKRNRLAREARAKAARERQEKNKAAAKAKELEANKGEEPATQLNGVIILCCTSLSCCIF